jgi:hypothetical protein
MRRYQDVFDVPIRQKESVGFREGQARGSNHTLISEGRPVEIQKLAMPYGPARRTQTAIRDSTHLYLGRAFH